MKKEDKKTKNEKPKAKTYVKPEVTKHKAASVVVGSCGSYSAETTSTGDYWY